MNDLTRALTSVIAATGAISLETVSTVFSILAALVAILAGLPVAIRTVRGWFAPRPAK